MHAALLHVLPLRVFLLLRHPTHVLFFDMNAGRCGLAICRCRAAPLLARRPPLRNSGPHLRRQSQTSRCGGGCSAHGLVWRQLGGRGSHQCRRRRLHACPPSAEHRTQIHTHLPPVVRSRPGGRFGVAVPVAATAQNGHSARGTHSPATSRGAGVSDRRVLFCTRNRTLTPLGCEFLSVAQKVQRPLVPVGEVGGRRSSVHATKHRASVGVWFRGRRGWQQACA